MCVCVDWAIGLKVWTCNTCRVRESRSYIKALEFQDCVESISGSFCAMKDQEGKAYSSVPSNHALWG